MKKTIPAALCGLFACALTSSAIPVTTPLTFDVLENSPTDIAINFTWGSDTGDATTYYNYDGASFIQIYGDPQAFVTLFSSEFTALPVSVMTFGANLNGDLSISGFNQPAFGTIADGAYSMTYTFTTRPTTVPDGGNTSNISAPST